MKAEQVAGAIVMKFMWLNTFNYGKAIEILETDIATAIEEGMIKMRWALEAALGDADYDETGVMINEEAMVMMYDVPFPELSDWIMPNSEEVQNDKPE